MRRTCGRPSVRESRHARGVLSIELATHQQVPGNCPQSPQNLFSIKHHKEMLSFHRTCCKSQSTCLANMYDRLRACTSFLTVDAIRLLTGTVAGKRGTTFLDEARMLFNWQPGESTLLSFISKTPNRYKPARTLHLSNAVIVHYVYCLSGLFFLHQHFSFF